MKASSNADRRQRGAPWLFGPRGLDELVTKYWGKRVMHVRRSDPHYFRHILTLDDLDAIMACSLPLQDPNAVMPLIVVENTKEEAPPKRKGKPTRYRERFLSGSRMLTQYYDRYSRGSTLLFPGAHRRWRPIAELCHALSEYFRCSTYGNVFLTPKNARGFPPHYDTHDVVVLQLHGEKTWRFRGSGFRRPLARHQLPTSLDPASLPKGFEVTLRPGDVLYVPRGEIHEASTATTSSMHLTVGIMSLTVEDVVLEAVRALADRTADLRLSLPLVPSKAGLTAMTKSVSKALARLDENAFARAETSLLARRIQEAWSVSRGRFEAFDRIDDLGPATVVRKRSGMPCTVVVESDHATILFPGESLQMSPLAARALRFIRDHESFAVQDLPGALSTGAKQILVRRLIEAGLLEIDPEAQRAKPRVA